MIAVSQPQPRQVFWIDARDHLPDDEATVLVQHGDDGEMTLAWHADGEWRDCGTAEIVDGVTHWADLPEAAHG